MRSSAQDAELPFHAFWLDVPLSTTLERVAYRTGEASDADADVIRRQSEKVLGAMTWQQLDGRVDALTDADRIAVTIGRR